MLPESPKRWPLVERLQHQLAREGLTMGVMEQVRLEHVLHKAGVPSEEAEFVDYVDEDPARLRRLLGATLAKSAAEREIVAGGFMRWKAGLPRDVQLAVKRPPGAGAGTSVTAYARVSASASSARRGGMQWVGLLMMLAALVIGGVAIIVGLSDGPDNAHIATDPEGSDSGGGPERAGRGGDGAGELSGSDGDVPSRYAMKSGALVDLTAVKVAVSKPELTVVPLTWWELAMMQWRSWLVGSLSLAVFMLLWRGTRRQPLLPGPAARTPRPGKGRVQPELDRGRLPAFVERSEQDTLIWGIGREVSDRRTDRLDAQRTVDATIARGGLPQLVFETAFEHRGVWLWRDRRMKAGQADAKRLQAEIVQTLKAAELPVHVATFARVPDSLQKVEGPTFSPHELDEHRRTARVVVLTDGHGLLRARTARSQLAVQDLLRRLQGWHALAVVVFGEQSGEVEQLLEPYGIPCLPPSDAVAHLAGALREGGGVERERELLRWEMACALAPLRIREIDALALRSALQLDIEGFAVDALRRRFGRGQHLVWGAVQRAATLAEYDRAFGYRAMGWDAVDDRALTGRALAFWREYYEHALATEELDPKTREHLHVEQLVLGLWDRPEEVVRGREGEDGLYALFQNEELEASVRELVMQYTDVNGEATRVRLPWRYEERPIDVRVMLGRMGFTARETVSHMQRAGRWGLGLGLALGVGVAALAAALMQTMMPMSALGGPEIRGGDGQSELAWSHCEASDDPDETRMLCTVASRFLLDRVWVPRGHVVVVNWKPWLMPCDFRDEVARIVRCTSQGHLAQSPPGRPTVSKVVMEAAPDDPGANQLARALLDTGSADAVEIVGRYQWDSQGMDSPSNIALITGREVNSGQRLWLVNGTRSNVKVPDEDSETVAFRTQDWDALTSALWGCEGTSFAEEVWSLGGTGRENGFVLVGPSQALRARMSPAKAEPTETEPTKIEPIKAKRSQPEGQVPSEREPSGRGAIPSSPKRMTGGGRTPPPY